MTERQPYERLPYADADTVDHMHDDADRVVAEMRLPHQVTVTTAVETVTGLAAEAAGAAKQTVVTVSEAAAKLAGRLLPF